MDETKNNTKKVTGRERESRKGIKITNGAKTKKISARAKNN